MMYKEDSLFYKHRNKFVLSLKKKRFNDEILEEFKQFLSETDDVRIYAKEHKEYLVIEFCRITPEISIKDLREWID